jgi:hypothetical protein
MDARWDDTHIALQLSPHLPCRRPCSNRTTTPICCGHLIAVQKQKRQVHGTLAGPDPGYHPRGARRETEPQRAALHSFLFHLANALLFRTRARAEPVSVSWRPSWWSPPPSANLKLGFVSFGRIFGHVEISVKRRHACVKISPWLPTVTRYRNPLPRRASFGTGPGWLVLATASFRSTSPLPSRVSRA